MIIIIFIIAFIVATVLILKYSTVTWYSQDTKPKRDGKVLIYSYDTLLIVQGFAKDGKIYAEIEKLPECFDYKYLD